MKKRTLAMAPFLLFMTCLLTALGQASKPNYPVYSVGGPVSAPKPISTPLPAPPADVNQKLTVRVSFVVAPDGSVADVRVSKRSKTDFDDYAVAAARSWKFEPARKDGIPVAVRIETEMKSHR